MDKLLEGYRRFRAQTWARERTRFEALAARADYSKAVLAWREALHAEDSPR